MLLGLSLFYVGVVLILNGIWMTGRIADREIVLINLCVATLSFLVALHIALTAQTVGDIRTATMVLLFAITYLWVAYNRLTGCDGRGLGWFSLIVAITVIPVALTRFAGAQGVMDLWLAICWTAWSVLWFVYFVLLALERRIERFTARFTLGVGITTGWMPGMAILYGA